MNAVQVRERGGRDRRPGCAATSPTLGPARRAPAQRTPRRRCGRCRVPFGPPLGTKPLGYLMDRIYTRDAWMHRIDIAAPPAGRSELTADHDGRIVADVVAEWARGHGQPYRADAHRAGRRALVARGDGEALTLDAVEFCRIVSGRAPGTGLLGPARAVLTPTQLSRRCGRRAASRRGAALSAAARSCAQSGQARARRGRRPSRPRVLGRSPRRRRAAPAPAGASATRLARASAGSCRALDVAVGDHRRRPASTPPACWCPGPRAGRAASAGPFRSASRTNPYAGPDVGPPARGEAFVQRVDQQPVGHREQPGQRHVRLGHSAHGGVNGYAVGEHALTTHRQAADGAQRLGAARRRGRRARRAGRRSRRPAPADARRRRPRRDLGAARRGRRRPPRGSAGAAVPAAPGASSTSQTLVSVEPRGWAWRAT